MWELSLFAQLWRGFFFFEIWKSNVQAPHLFLPVCCSVREGYCNIGVWNQPPRRSERTSSGYEWVHPAEAGRDRELHAIRREGGSQTKINVTDYFALLVKKQKKKTKTFIQNRWQLCKRKRGCFRDSQRKTSSVQNISSGKKKRKKGTCSSHHISCLNPL